MKLKVTAKDLMIFGVFCIFLLYFSAIAVLNVFTLINDGEFYGFLPFEAFTGKYIFGTLLVFFSVLVAIFLSVSSSIFERKDGIGFEIGEKESKGYSRWLKEKEMKKAYKIYKVGVKDETASAGGVVLINDGKNMWVDDSEYHTLVIGVTGSGKTSAVVDPLTYSLVKHGESMVFTDPKGEIYKDHAELLKARGYKIIVLNFRDPQNGNSWNPLTLPYQLYHEGNVDKAIELVDDVANNIVKSKGGNNDPFWQDSASDYFAGCTLGLLEDAKEEEVNLNSIGYMTTVGEEKFGAGSTYIKEYFTMKGEQSSAYTFASNTINSPTETKGGILSTFRQKIRIFSSRENLSEMLSYSDFNMRDIGREKTAVFMIIHDEKTTYHALATIFIKQCYETLISVAQENGGKLPVRTNFILDEFANMPALKDVTTMVTAARSRQIRFTFIIQNFAQLNEVYGEHDAETIRANCGNLIYLLTTELAALEEISKLCGEVKSKKDDKTESHPLVTISDLQKMKLNEVIILRSRCNPFKTRLVQAYTVDWGTSQYGKAELPSREKKEIQLFDVKEFVKVRKRSKMGMDEKTPTSPMAGGFPNFASIANSGLNSNANPSMPRIPTFEEFMAARNAAKKNEAAKPKPNVPKFDVDDLVKRIDAKIAELEAQEKEEESKKINQPSVPTEVTQNEVDKVVNESEKEPVVNVVESASIQNVNTEIGFNPFNKEEVKETKFIDKDVIDNIEEQLETMPIKPPIIEDKVEKTSTSAPTFEDIIKTNEVVVPEGKPSIMIQNPIKEIPVNVTTQQPVFEIKKEVPNVIQEINTPKEATSNVVSPVGQVVSINTQASVQPTVIERPINTQVQVTQNTVPVPPVQPNNTQVVSNVSDDEFFDDFFEDD